MDRNHRKESLTLLALFIVSIIFGAIAGYDFAEARGQAIIRVEYAPCH